MIEIKGRRAHPPSQDAKQGSPEAGDETESETQSSSN